MPMAASDDDALTELIDQCWLDPNLSSQPLRQRATRLLTGTDPAFRRYLSLLLDEASIGTAIGARITDPADLLAALALSEYRLEDVLNYPPEMRQGMLTGIAAEAGMTSEELLRVDHWWRIESNRRTRQP